MKGEIQRSERLLVVEDDEFSQQLIQLYLRKAGFAEVTAAGDGRQALDLVRGSSFDLMLLDLNLPRLSGAEVLRRLKRDGGLADIPVIIISSITNMEETVECLDLGADDYLPKPFNVRLLADRVAGCLERRRLRREVASLSDRLRRGEQACQNARSAFARFETAGAADAAAVIIAAETPGGDVLVTAAARDGSVCLVLGSLVLSGVETAAAAARISVALHRIIDGTPLGAPDPADILVAIAGELGDAALAAPASLACAVAAAGRLALAKTGAAAGPLMLWGADGNEKPIPQVLADMGGGASVTHVPDPGDRILLASTGLHRLFDFAGAGGADAWLSGRLKGLEDGPAAEAAAVLGGMLNQLADQAGRPVEASLAILRFA